VLCLTTRTDPRWAEVALADLPALLADHAHCEMKAASNALSLAMRCPLLAPLRVARVLVEIAEEELQHYRAILDELLRRGLPLGPPDPDEYASELRRAAARTGGRTPKPALADRLLVGALIEARSCERFRLLADALAARGHDLAPLYEELFAAEARHYTTFVDLAADVLGDEAAARARLSEIARAEGELAARLGAAPAVHG
jgi:tRNA-(ms[2]io[6]A)-hydroxylase